MSLSMRRVRAIFVKELREYGRNRSLVAAMALYPLIFTVQPLIAIFAAPSATAASIAGRHELTFMLGIPILVPAALAAFAVAGERQQETLEPVLATPITREEFLLGKALAVFLPSLVIAYFVFALFIAVVELFAKPGIAPALISTDDVIVQVLFTPLLAAWSIWVGIAVSTRSNDVRVAQQLSVLSSLPLILVTIMFAFNIIQPSFELVVLIGVLLFVADVIGWRLIAPLFNREKLISGPH
jgi:ABC-2 type transport system permease protein